MIVELLVEPLKMPSLGLNDIILGGIRIEAAGVALEPGQLGQDIRVTNAGSGEVVHVTVTGRNKVMVRPNIR